MADKNKMFSFTLSELPEPPYHTILILHATVPKGVILGWGGHILGLKKKESLSTSDLECQYNNN